MKLSGLLLFIMLFVVIPAFVLQTLLMPALEQLRYNYKNADSIVSKAIQD